MSMPLTVGHLDQALCAFASHINDDLHKTKKAMDSDGINFLDKFNNIDTLAAIGSNRSNKALGHQVRNDRRRKKQKFT